VELKTRKKKDAQFVRTDLGKAEKKAESVEKRKEDSMQLPGGFGVLYLQPCVGPSVRKASAGGEGEEKGRFKKEKRRGAPALESGLSAGPGRNLPSEKKKIWG